MRQVDQSDLGFWRSLDVPSAVDGLSLQRVALCGYLDRLHKALWTAELKVTSYGCQVTVKQMSH